MPKEVRLLGPKAVRATGDGGREIVVQVSPNEVHIIPFDPSERVQCGEGLAMDDEKLRQKAEGQRAASRLVVPNGAVTANGQPA
jgi:hypothetical protein